MLIDWNDFEKVEMHTGRIIEAMVSEGAIKNAYRLKIDFGPVIGIKKSSAQLTAHYSVDELLEKSIIAVTNFPPKQIGNFLSEVLVLGISDQEGNVVLLSTDKEVPNGQKVF